MEPISLRPKKSEDYRDFPSMLGDCCTTVHLSGPKELADLPEEGTITFKFERRSITISDGSKPVQLDLKLLSVEDACEAEIDEEEDAAEDEMDSGAAIDKLMGSADDEVE